ncbi:MAG TPA: leucyl/phenylalanyl-tRNA--protein transferase [Caulobacteraceae bacterium]
MGQFTTEDLLDFYRRGYFPMADARNDKRMVLVEPVRRGVLPLDGLKISRRLARTVRQKRFDIRVDTAFAAVIDACAAPRPDGHGTWISHTIQSLYVDLHRRGQAHSVEAWREGDLVGGLYGVALGAAFFGESMVSINRDASKVALVHLVARLRAGGFELLDTQFLTDHLQSLGAIEIPQSVYLGRLRAALKKRADFGRFDQEGGAGAAAQDSSQAS